MEKIEFSVLMSVYRGDTLDNVKIALESILNQTLKPNQIVLMVDGPISKDLHELLDLYEKNEKIIDLHYRDKNLGLGLILNEGLNYCKYEYVARMDADDFCLDNRFKEQISYIEKHPEVDVVGCNISEYDNDLKYKIAERFVPENDQDIKKYMKSRNGINHVTVIYKKSSVLSVNSYENYPYFEDYYLWCKMIKNGYTFYNIQKSLMNIRAGQDMSKRRGGFKYCKFIHKFEKGIKRLGIINSFVYIKNLIIRYGVAIIPNDIRALLYKKQLRKN